MNKEKVFEIMRTFEEFLDEHNINIPNKERDEYETDKDTTPAILFGSDYYNLEDKIKSILENEKENNEILSKIIISNNPKLEEEYLKYKKDSIKDGINLSECFFNWLVYIKKGGEE